MKNLIISIVLLIALIFYFSCFGYSPMETTNPDGYAPRHKGDSGLIIPGDGELLAEVSFEPESAPERLERTEDEQTGEAEVTEITETVTEETSEEIHTENITKEKNKMDGVVIAFWHGVAAVLIGEASALMVAIALLKIKGSVNHVKD